MIACPKCGTETTVTETRITKSGARRRRRCVSGYRVTTLEAIIHGPVQSPMGDVVIVRRADLNALVAAMTTMLTSRDNAKDLVEESVAP